MTDSERERWGAYLDEPVVFTKRVRSARTAMCD